MRKFLFFAVSLILLAACGGRGSGDGADSQALADSLARVEAERAAELARLDSLRQDSIFRAQSEVFIGLLPDAKALSMKEFDNGTLSPYLRTIGFSQSGQYSWQLDTLGRKCIVSVAETDQVSEGPGLRFKVTISGDTAALNSYYRQALALQEAMFGSDYSVSLQDSTVVTTEFDRQDLGLDEVANADQGDE